MAHESRLLQLHGASLASVSFQISVKTCPYLSVGRNRAGLGAKLGSIKHMYSVDILSRINLQKYTETVAALHCMLVSQCTTTVPGIVSCPQEKNSVSSVPYFSAAEQEHRGTGV